MDYFAYKGPVDKGRIYQLLDELLHLVHAGFLKTDISSADLAIIRSHLSIEIGLCAALVGAELDVERVTAAFFARVEGIIELLSGDLEAIFEGDPAADSSFEIVLAYPGFMRSVSIVWHMSWRCWRFRFCQGLWRSVLIL